MSIGRDARTFKGRRKMPFAQTTSKGMNRATKSCVEGRETNKRHPRSVSTAFAIRRSLVGAVFAPSTDNTI